MRRLAATLFLCIAFASSVALHRSMYAMQQEEKFPFRSYFIPSSQEMKIFSLGYRNFWSDLVYIWALLYYDYYNREVRYQYLERTFEVITDLDPKNKEAYVMCALFAFLGNKWDLYYAFLDKGMQALPTDATLPFEAATTAFFSEKNNERAAHYFRLASERAPEKNLFKKFLAQAMASKGDAQAATAYWREIYLATEHDTSPEGNFYRGAALRNLWDLKVKGDLHLLTKAVLAFEERHGRSPSNLGGLVSEGFLPALPLDPKGEPYRYDPKTGVVDCASAFDHRAAYKGW